MNAYLHKKAETQIDTNEIVARYQATRARSIALAEGLSDADQTVQSMADCSPTKWHLAHTTWFFEAFILVPHASNYSPFNERFFYLFNSYYEQAGPRHPRPQRGMLTRPSASEISQYRAHVDEAMAELLASGTPDARVTDLLILGCNHEEQHQELLQTDILHLFAQNPLKPALRSSIPIDSGNATTSLKWIEIDGGVVEIGEDESDPNTGFIYDCESPRHEVLIRPFKIANRLVTNEEWIEFIQDDAYHTATLWLADGWATLNNENWQAPLYWEQRDGTWWSMTLHGPQPLNEKAPVTHISYFEAEAFARWSGKRLPTEFEWERSARLHESAASREESHPDLLMPRPATGVAELEQLYSDVWQWTGSSYLPYPGFKTAEGAVGEYNGKFMCGQFILRGGSCATSPGHSRRTYRNFFYPQQRWQFSGLRLAEDN
ncbi:MAG: ergothioneine biosynthesis protein EgtB [Stappiaceae bacterium]